MINDFYVVYYTYSFNLNLQAAPAARKAGSRVILLNVNR